MSDALQHFFSHWDDGLAYAALLWIAQAFIGTMPQPQPMERWYGWAYGFLQAIAANLDRIKPKEPPK